MKFKVGEKVLVKEEYQYDEWRYVFRTPGTVVKSTLGVYEDHVAVSWDGEVGTYSMDPDSLQLIVKYLDI